MNYRLEDKPGLPALCLYGLQWWVVSLPCVVITGVVVSRLHFPGLAEQTLYLRKLFGLTGVAMMVQVLWGHRLPLVPGPASTLLVGIVAAGASSIAAVYTSLIVGGGLMALAAFSGVLHRLRVFFTPRIVAVILILIAFTLAPTILKLILPGTDKGVPHLFFAIAAVFALALCNTLLPGVWKSLTVIIGMAGGSLAYALAFGAPPVAGAQGPVAGTELFIPGLEFHAGTILSFFFCYLALLINELGSIESVGHMLRADNMNARITRGVGLQGLANMLAGGLGVIGPVDYSMSAGIIAATGCASRLAFVPAALGMLACAFLPGVILLLAAIPGVVMGALLLYLMATQLSSGLSMLVSEKGITDFTSGLTVGLPVMLGLLIAFVPESAFADVSGMFRPIIGNGFVMGVFGVILLEHAVFRNKDKKRALPPPPAPDPGREN